MTLANGEVTAVGKTATLLGFASRTYLEFRMAMWFVLIMITLHEKAAAAVAEATVRFFSQGLEKKPAPTLEEWETDFLTWWDTAISFISPMVKDPGFRAEEEYRIIRPLFEADGLSEMKFIQKSTMMSRHLPLRLPAGDGNEVPKLPIAKYS